MHDDNDNNGDNDERPREQGRSLIEELLINMAGGAIGSYSPVMTILATIFYLLYRNWGLVLKLILAAVT